MQLKPEDPGEFTIAADIRCGKTNYTNDHIWMITLAGGEPPALAIQTTFGLRAKSHRLFPRFVEDDNVVIDPGEFSSPPTVKKVFPNYIEIVFSPFEAIDVKCEYWIPESNILAGKLQVTNSRLNQRQIIIQWAALLSPTEGGQQMASKEIESTTILQGQTTDLFPIIFMTGGPIISAGPYPALSVEMDLSPGSTRQLTWVHTALENIESSFDLARRTAARSWDAEIARLDVINNNLLEIETGDRDWDAAFALAQKSAISFFVGPTEYLPNPSIVLCRGKDHGFSSVGNGLDYEHLWNGQSPLEVDYLSTILLPAGTKLLKGLLLNFLETQTGSGFIDYRPGLAGQRSRIMATPVLAKLTWRIYQATGDSDFLEEVFPKLISFIQGWFTDQQDRDGDGLPEWARASQSGFEDHPTFSQWHPWSQGCDISKIESPSLCSMLYNEINILIKMAHTIGQLSPLAGLKALADNLKSAVDASWDEDDAIYHNWDRESHFSSNGQHLGIMQGPGELSLNQDFEQPVRLSFRVDAAEDLPRRICIFIHGTGTSGTQRIERIEGDQFRWHIERGNVSSEQIYTSVEYIETIRLDTQDKVTIGVMDLSVIDHTLLIPIWAGIPRYNRAHNLIKKTILNPYFFWKPFGIVACPQQGEDADHPCSSVHMVWNNLIGEGLLRYGYRAEVADLISRVMDAIITNLKTNKAFYTYYQAESGLGVGETNTLTGLPPIRLFLETLGVRIITPTKILLCGKNPFPWSVTLRFRGLTVIRETNKTRVIFPGGQSAVVKSDEPRLITLEGNKL